MKSGTDYRIPKSFRIITTEGSYTIGTETVEQATSWANVIKLELFGPFEAGKACKWQLYNCM